MFRPQDIRKQERELEQERIKAQTLTLTQKERVEKKKVEEEKILIEEERIYRRGITNVKDLIAPEALEVKPTLMKLGKKFVRTIFVIGYPRYISVGWFSPIINLNVTLDVSMFFKPVKTEIILKQLRNKVGNLEAQLIADAEKGAPRAQVHPRR